jgi:LmbE family N-acetylglucosaminyl deacetylase
MNILILAAHPDDETLGCGATIKKLTQIPNTYSKLITFTDGESSRLDKKSEYNRNDKLENVCNYLGINEYVCGDFPDNKMDTIPLLDLCKFIEKNVNFHPDLIFTHHRNCLNIDHQLVYKATLTSFRPQNGNKQKILSYYVPSSTDYNPYNNFQGNIYYDIENTINDKIKCLELYYNKEMREYPHTRSYENILNLSKVCGSEVGLKFAEKFELIREIN